MQPSSEDYWKQVVLETLQTSMEPTLFTMVLKIQRNPSLLVREGEGESEGGGSEEGRGRKRERKRERERTCFCLQMSKTTQKRAWHIVRMSSSV